MTYTGQKIEQTLAVLNDTYLIGHRDLIMNFLITYFSGGHLLVEGPPGTGKTLAAKLFARVTGKKFQRIQFTSDMLPSDILGASLFSPATQSFSLIKGPVFSQFILADEINRTPPRTQSALLEAMEERQVTIDGETHGLDPHFFVIATQNPRDYEGTFPLPEAQLDRFLMQIKVDGLNVSEEQLVLQQFLEKKLPPPMENLPVLDVDLHQVQQETDQVQISQPLLSYIASLVSETRTHSQLLWGASTRACIALLKSSRVLALASRRNFVTPDDVKQLAPSILRHRVQLHPEGQVAGLKTDQVIEDILEKVPFPT